VFGSEHPSTAFSLADLAETKLAERKYPEAETLFKESLAINAAMVAGHTIDRIELAPRQVFSGQHAISPVP
jgi:hypothetical protein